MSKINKASANNSSDIKSGGTKSVKIKRYREIIERQFDASMNWDNYRQNLDSKTNKLKDGGFEGSYFILKGKKAIDQYQFTLL